MHLLLLAQYCVLSLFVIPCSPSTTCESPKPYIRNYPVSLTAHISLPIASKLQSSNGNLKDLQLPSRSSLHPFKSRAGASSLPGVAQHVTDWQRLRGGSSGKQTWRQLVNESREIPYPIMASPLTPKEELDRIDQARIAAEQSREGPQLPRLSAGTQQVQDWGPVAPDDGTWGPPDHSGKRWKLLKTNEEYLPYPRVPLKYKMNATMAAQDPHLQGTSEGRTTEEEEAYMREQLEDETGLLPFIQRYNDPAHRERVKEYLKHNHPWWLPRVNTTLAPYPENPSGYVLLDCEVSRYFKFQGCEAADSDTKGNLLAVGDNRVGQLGFGYESGDVKPHGSVPQFMRGGEFWGWDDEGNAVDEVGFDSWGSVTIPQAVPRFMEKEIKSISCGWNHVFAVVRGDDGSEMVYGWGRNDFGQLGMGHRTDVYEPKTVPGLCGHDILQIACGDMHTLVLRKDGSVLTFGSNEELQLGIGDVQAKAVDSSFPILIPPEVFGGSQVSAVACGAFHNLAVANGKLFAWGTNCCGQLGFGDTNSSDIPRLVPALEDQNVTLISCGGEHSVAVVNHNDVRTWGKDHFGQLGMAQHKYNGFMPDPGYCRALVPGKAVFIPTPPDRKVEQVACGRDHTLIMYDTGEVWGCGYNHYGQLGLEHLANALHFTPLSISWGQNLGCGTALQVAAGEEYTVAVLADGRIVGCGNNANGQLGIGHWFQMARMVEIPAFTLKSLRLCCASKSTFAWKPCLR